LLAVGLLLAGCGNGGGEQFAVEQRYGEDAAVEFRVRLSETEVTTSEQLTLVLETRADERYEVVFPEIGEQLGEFAVADQEPEERRLQDDGSLVSTRRYTLEPPLAGDYEIPEMELSFGTEDGQYPFGITTDPISVTVTSVLPPAVGEQEIEDIEGPVEPDRNLPLYIGIGAGALAVLALIGFLVVRGVRHGTLTPAKKPVPSWVRAEQELDQLLAEGLVEQGQVEAFYTRITDILRRYVEERFQIHAPEQTTEEFLDQASRSEEVSGHRESLEHFLTHADLVKFARYTPEQSEIDNTVEACRTFIAETRGSK
jgi:hypothetical protein